MLVFVLSLSLSLSLSHTHTHTHNFNSFDFVGLVVKFVSGVMTDTIILKKWGPSATSFWKKACYCSQQERLGQSQHFACNAHLLYFIKLLLFEFPNYCPQLLFSVSVKWEAILDCVNCGIHANFWFGRNGSDILNLPNKIAFRLMHTVRVLSRRLVDNKRFTLCCSFDCICSKEAYRLQCFSSSRLHFIWEISRWNVNFWCFVHGWGYLNPPQKRCFEDMKCWLN